MHIINVYSLTRHVIWVDECCIYLVKRVLVARSKDLRGVALPLFNGVFMGFVSFGKRVKCAAQSMMRENKLKSNLGTPAISFSETPPSFNLEKISRGVSLVCGIWFFVNYFGGSKVLSCDIIISGDIHTST